VLRPARTGSRTGPLYAASEDVAAALVHGLSATTPGFPVALDVPDIDAAPVKLVERLGLRPSFECARMCTGPDPDVDLDLDLAGIFATTSL
jgi:hypothetical protein